MKSPYGSAEAGRVLVPALLVVLATTLSFGLFVRGFGLYYDDYPSWSLYLRDGTAALVAFAAGQARPLVGLLPALAGTPAGSHWLMFLVHSLNGLVFLLLLRRLWPAADRATGLAALLFCVYPAYWLRPTHIALAIDGSLLLALLSLWLGLLALDRSGRARSGLTLVSVLFVPCYLLLYELPVGLELLRPVLIALDRRRAGAPLGGRRILSLSAPWLATLGLFAAWRLFVFVPAGDYERLRYNALALPATAPEAVAIVGRLLYSVGELLVGAWWATLGSRESASTVASEGLAPGLAAALALAVAVWLWRVRGSGTTGPRVAAEMAGLGLLIVVLGQIAPLATGNVTDAQGMFSRWALVSTLGASLTWASLTIARPSSPRVGTLGGLGVTVLFAIGAWAHVENALAFSRDWENQRATWWQLGERVGTPPSGTLVVLDETWEPALDRTRFEYELTLSAELFFGPGSGVVATTSSFATQGESRNPRAFSLMGRTWQVDLEQMLLASHNEGCLEVVSRDTPLPAGKTLSPNGSSLLSRARTPPLEPVSVPPTTRRLFEPDPAGWCRHYQAARREEQRGNDEAVVGIGEEAWARGLEPELPSEWDVFREASRRARGRGFPPRVAP